MKTKVCMNLILAILFLLNPMWIKAQDANNIVGVWITNKQDSKIKIVKNTDGTFSGKIIWAQIPHEDFEGIEIIKGMIYNADDNTYSCPWLYDPKMKVTARAIVSIEGNLLNLKARKGIITVKEVFTRVK